MLGVAEHFESSGTRLETGSETRDLRVVGPGLGRGDERRGGCRPGSKEESRDDPGFHSGTGVTLGITLKDAVEVRL